MDLLRPRYTDQHREIADRLRSRLNIAGSLLDARMALGLTQEEVGRLAGTKQSRVSEIEAMKGNPTLDTLDRIGRAVGLALDYVPLRERTDVQFEHGPYVVTVEAKFTETSATRSRSPGSSPPLAWTNVPAIPVG